MSRISKDLVIRVEGMANSYGVGEKVTEDGRVVLFKAGNYNLTASQLQAKLKAGIQTEEA